jgi:hypothetical protein
MLLVLPEALLRDDATESTAESAEVAELLGVRPGALAFGPKDGEEGDEMAEGVEAAEAEDRKRNMIQMHG